MNNKVIILFNELSQNATSDELDVLDQVELIKKTLLQLGYEPIELMMGFNLVPVIKVLEDIKPIFAVNLFESIENKSEFLYFGPAILNSLHIPYTGFPLEALFLTTQKVLTKQQLQMIGIPTPNWFTHDNIKELQPFVKYIVKPLWEEGSLGLDEDCIFSGNNQTFIENIGKNSKSNSYFIEEYIEGREFNISMLASPDGTEVLPFAEIDFRNFPEDKHKMVGYKAKWVEDSFEYNNTPRTFELENLSSETKNQITEICKKCWNHFGGKGYARIDFRLSQNNIPYVLEINGNPCITPGGGFYAALEQANYSFEKAFERIVQDALK